MEGLAGGDPSRRDDLLPKGVSYGGVGTNYVENFIPNQRVSGSGETREGRHKTGLI